MTYGFSNVFDDKIFAEEFMRDSGYNGKQLKTTRDNRTSEQRSLTSYTLSDILLGTPAIRGTATTANAFSHMLTSELQTQITNSGKGTAVLGGAKAFAPSDLMSQSFYKAGAGATAATGTAATSTGSLETGESNADTGLPNPTNGTFTDTTGVEPAGTYVHHDTGRTIILSKYQGTILQAGCIASYKKMWDEANLAGFNISGGGHRTYDSQMTLRNQNCPDPINSRASDCSPPTAKPGRSMHEWGLAVDISNLTNSNFHQDVYNWMVANASTYGWIQLESERWHWSTNGG